MTDDLPTGYKMTELGPLPEDWRVVRLGEAAEKPQYGFTAAAQSEPVGPKMLRITDIQEGNVNWNTVPYCECAGEDIPKYLLEAGDILFARTGSVGKAFLVSSVPEHSIFASYLIRVRVDRTKLDPQFAFLFMQSTAYWRQIASQIHGAVQPNVNATQLRSLLLPLPPLPEQRAIAHVLRTVQEAKEATERVIAALRELKKSLMRHLFTCGPVPLDAAGNVELRETEIGPIPAHWQVVRLGEVATLSTKAVDPANAGAKRYIGLEHIEPGNIRIQHWGKADDVRSLKTAFQQGDVLYGKLRPYLDKAVLAEWDGICSTDILVIKAQSSLLPEFLAYLVHTSQFIDYAISTTTGVNHPRTSWKALQKFPIPLPPLDEQREIARILQAVDTRIAAEQARRQALEALFRALLHDLMTARRRLPPEFVARFVPSEPPSHQNPQEDAL